jgi:hypothetical protein
VVRIEVIEMTTAEKLHPQFITDSSGRQTGVILPLEEYNELLEDLDDLAAIAERADEPTIPHVKVVAELKKDGCLSD